MLTGQLDGVDWLYFTNICALCRREDQPWALLLDSLHVPFLLGRIVSIMLEAEFQQDPIYKHLIAVVMATANLLSTACREAEQAGSSLLHMGTLMCHQLASSGMFERLPLVMGDIARALSGVSDGHALGHHSATLTLLGMPFLQLFTDLSAVWPGGILGSTAAGPTTAAALQLAVAVVKQCSGRAFHIPSMLRWMSANVILQLTDPAAVAAAGNKTHSLTSAPCFLQAVVTALAVQAQWLLQPAAKGSSGYASSNASNNHSSSSMLGSGSLSSFAGGSSVSVASTGSSKGWLFGRNRLQDNLQDTAPQKDQGRSSRQRLLPSHSLLLECLGLTGAKAEELVDAVYREGARPISQQNIQAYVDMYRGLAQHMRLVTIGPPVQTDAGRMYQLTGQQWELLRLQQLLPVMLVSIAAHAPANFGLVMSAAAAAQEALCWWPLLMKPGQLLDAGAFKKQPVEQLPVQELLQLLVQTVQKVLQQQDSGIAAALAAAAHEARGEAGEYKLPTKAGAIRALAETISTLCYTCIECDGRNGSLLAWQQTALSLADAFDAAAYDAVIASEGLAAAVAAAAAGTPGVFNGPAGGLERAVQLQQALDTLLVVLLYAERFFFLDDTSRPPLMAASGLGKPGDDAAELFAMLLSTL